MVGTTGNTEEPFFDPPTRINTWSQLKDSGCVVIADAISLFHPSLRNALLQSGVVSSDRVAIFILSPANSHLLEINSFIQKDIIDEVEFAFKCFESWDKLYEFGLAGVQTLQRWLTAVIPDVEKIVTDERLSESKRRLIRGLGEPRDIHKLVLHQGGPAP